MDLLVLPSSTVTSSGTSIIKSIFSDCKAGLIFCANAWNCAGCTLTGWLITGCPIIGCDIIGCPITGAPCAGFTGAEAGALAAAACCPVPVAIDSVSCSIFFDMLEYISFAKENGYNCIIWLSTRSPISILKQILTNSPARKLSMEAPSNASVKSTISAVGGLISIILFSIEDREVAAEPII